MKTDHLLSCCVLHVHLCVCVYVCELTFVTSVCVLGVECVQQVDGAGGSGFATVLLLMVC